MRVTLFKCSKRYNSDAAPSIATRKEISGAIINDAVTSVVNPVITLPANANIYYQDYNYCSIDKFYRSYFIRNWQYNGNGTWSATLDLDALYTWHYTILNSKAYINRISGKNKNPSLIDNLYPAANGYTLIDDIPVSNDFLDYRPSSSCFLLGIIENGETVFGAANYYLVDYTNLNKLVSKMVSPYATAPTTDWQNTQLTSELLKTIVSPMQYIIDCKWLPVGSPYLPVGNAPIKLGAWDSTAVGLKLGVAPTDSVEGVNFDGTNIYKDRTISLPTLSESNVRFTDFIPGPPYTTYTYYNPLIGSIDIDPLMASNSSSFKIQSRYNLISGVYSLRFFFKNSSDGAEYTDVPYQNYEFDASVSIPIADVSNQYINLAKTGLQAVGTAANVAGWVFNPVGNAISLADNAIDMLQYTFNQAVVSNGAAATAFVPEIVTPQVIIKVIKTFPQNDSLFGHPLGKTYDRIIDAFDQDPANEVIFVKTNNCELENMFYTGINSGPDPTLPSMLAEERDMIINLLREGVYLRNQ